ncbi:MAG: D-alanine--D-alanine ligase family protein [Patescibacteria group bacterium]|jgi:D-alanine-D-alanine ligase
MKKNLLLMFGGPSVEHDVSVITAMQALKYIDHSAYNIIPFYWTNDGQFLTVYDPPLNPHELLAKLAKKGVEVSIQNNHLLYKSGLFSIKPLTIDIAFPLFHGTGGEDGAVQGLLEALDVPYVGCNVSASALGMDKILFKAIMHENKIPVLPYQAVNSPSDKVNIGFPVIAKPSHLGSSIGVAKADNQKQLTESFATIFQLDTQAIVEPYLTNMIEINCSVLGTAKACESSVCEQPISSSEILSYADKYLHNGKGKKGAKGMASLDRRIPAPISEAESKKIKTYAENVFKVLGCSGVARVDFMIDQSNSNIYVTEINTIPGSLSFYLWEASGLNYPDLIKRLFAIAVEQHQIKHKLVRQYKSDILQKI